MNKKVLISGVTGQDGSHMVDYLLETTNHEIYGIVRRTSLPNYSNLKQALLNNRFKLVTGDLSDSQSIDNIVKNILPNYFINLGAQSFVKSSWDLPEQTMDINAIGVIRCLEAIRKNAPNCRFYNAGCYDIKTRIVTPDGIKDYKNVKVGDLVYSINTKTRKLELKPIKRVIEKTYNGKMIHFLGQNKDFLVTPDHKMLIDDGNEIIFENAQDVIKRKSFLFPNANWDGVIQEEYTDLKKFIPEKYWEKEITEIKTIKTKDLFYLMGLYIGDGSCNIIKKKVMAVPFEVRELHKNKSSRRYQNIDHLTKVERMYECPRIYIDIPPEDECYKRVTDLLTKCNIKWNLHGTCDIYFSSWGLYYFFNQCGHKAHLKSIPKWCLEANPEYLLELYNGIMDSDGDGRAISTVSKQLVNDLIELGIKLGYRTQFSNRGIRQATLKDGRVIKGNYDGYEVAIQNSPIIYNKYSVGNKNINTSYNGIVWCLEVEDNHNFLIERNGKIAFCGNSSEEFGDVQYSPQDEKHPLRARSPYGSSKIAARQIVKTYRESFNLYAIQGYLFNHEGERRGEEFVTRKITKGVARIKKALDDNLSFEPIELGNLDAKRDWSHSKDFVIGIWMMINQENYRQDIFRLDKQNWNCGTSLPSDGKETQIIQNGLNKFWCENIIKLKEYVLSSNETHSIREFVELAFNEIGIYGYWNTDGSGKPEYQIYTDENNKYCFVKINPKFYRPSDVENLWGNSDLARKELGWKPQISFNELVRRMVKSDIENS